MQSEDACQSTGQEVRFQIDLDTLGQDAFDLAGSAPAERRQDSGPGTAKKKAHRGNKHRGRDRTTPHQKTWHHDP